MGRRIRSFQRRTVIGRQVSESSPVAAPEAVTKRRKSTARPSAPPRPVGSAAAAAAAIEPFYGAVVASSGGGVAAYGAPMVMQVSSDAIASTWKRT